ncbi:hypothetical protein [Mucilaginibacter terrenus]|uniref:hypothetical protein n=1 Tax=Mucilaginibacter terrenus TaxID=2482727 RepID=UPI001403DF46|nr:hypothetical protein [Mucilaginibacter terrenus]
MEAGYTTIDLVMLMIAALVIWMTMRTPKLKYTGKQTLTDAKQRERNHQQYPSASM